MDLITGAWRWAPAAGIDRDRSTPFPTSVSSFLCFERVSAVGCHLIHRFLSFILCLKATCLSSVSPETCWKRKLSLKQEFVGLGIRLITDEFAAFCNSATKYSFKFTCRILNLA